MNKRSPKDIPEQIIHKLRQADESKAEGHDSQGIARQVNVATECTRVEVAHRLSSMVEADKTCVMDDGTIVKSGTQDELLSRSGPYRDLVLQQVKCSAKERERSA